MPIRKAAERVRMTRRSPWWGEHRSRYHWAAEFVAGNDVLDVGCGTGYGLTILADAGADLAVGVDHDLALADSLRTSTNTVCFCVGNAGDLPFQNNSFDLVTSFETLEHLEQAERFLGEVNRVLKSSGEFLMSTPNALITQPTSGVPKNPFHVHEYEPGDLQDLLNGHFTDVSVMGQRVVDAFGFCPIWATQDRHTRPLSTLVWRVIHSAVPFDIKDRIARLRHNRGFYPGEYDFDFVSNNLETAHVLVASCRN